MAEVSIRDLRNRGGDIVDRAERGERLTITRAGTPVAELTALRAEPLALEVLVARRRNLPPVDPRALRNDLDALVDPTV